MLKYQLTEKVPPVSVAAKYYSICEVTHADSQHDVHIQVILGSAKQAFERLSTTRESSYPYLQDNEGIQNQTQGRDLSLGTSAQQFV